MLSSAQNPLFRALRDLISLKRAKKCSDRRDVLSSIDLLTSNAQHLRKLPSGPMQSFRRALKSTGISFDEENREIIHVVGTKGKGSTVAFADSLLTEAGCSTVAFTSPHVQSVYERITFNGKQDHKKFNSAFFSVWDKCINAPEFKISEDEVWLPPFFHFMSLVGLEAAKQQHADYLLLEAGIGAKNDVTNLCKPAAVGLTQVDLDHTEIFGSEIDDILDDKKMAIKKNVPVYCADQDEHILNVYKKQAKDVGTSLQVIKPHSHCYEYGIPGPVSSQNSALAQALVEEVLGRPLEISELENGFSKTFLPSRFHKLVYPNNTFFVDGAHCPIAMKACSQWFRTQRDMNRESALLVGLTGDRTKHAREVFEPLFALNSFDHVFCTNRELRPILEELSGKPVEFVRVVRSVVKGPLQNCDILVTGSLHLAGEGLNHITDYGTVPPINK
ncbi:hypothetical protein PCE1_002299 [Barthelona sp. PCE]